jgi:exonuclease V
MLYKELLDALLLPPRDPDNEQQISGDAILPSETPFSWQKLFDYLHLDTEANFSPEFISQSRPIIAGNGLGNDVVSARSITDMVECWIAYVAALGLGAPNMTGKTERGDRTAGRTEERLELVYRRAGANNRKKSAQTSKKGGRSASSRKGKRKNAAAQAEQRLQGREVYNEGEAMQKAIAESLQESTANASIPPSQTVDEDVSIDEINRNSEDEEVEDEELAWAVEMSLGATVEDISAEERGEVIIRASQIPHTDAVSPSWKQLSSPLSSPPPLSPSTQAADLGLTQISPAPTNTEESYSASGSGSIIGRSVFTHSPRRLTAHLSSVLRWWMGERDAVGVSIEETSRCAWCEFEEACEWR